MKILVTGDRGYIGSVLTQMLEEKSHEVVDMTSIITRGQTFIPPNAPTSKSPKTFAIFPQETLKTWMPLFIWPDSPMTR